MAKTTLMFDTDDLDESDYLATRQQFINSAPAATTATGPAPKDRLAARNNAPTDAYGRSGVSLYANISPELHTRFKIKCAQNQLKVKQALIALVEAYCDS